MDLSTIIGWVGGTAAILISIFLAGEHPENLFEFGNIGSFWDPASIFIVIGGTIMTLMVMFPLKVLTKIPKHLKICFFPTKYDPHKYIAELVEFATEARINGLLALEDKLTDTKDEFMKSSLMLVVDSVDPEKVKTLLETELEYLDDRHAQDRAFYDKGSALAPAFGMIGTLIGLIMLMGGLDDPNNVGPLMGVALITTFYGTILSNFIFAPISNKLKVRHEEEYLCKLIISEGVQAIQAGENPRFIEEKLTQLLPKSKKGHAASGEGGEAGGGKEKKGKGKK